MFFYYAENGENSMRELSSAIGKMLGYGEQTKAMTVAQGIEEWGRHSISKHSHKTKNLVSRVRQNKPYQHKH